MRTLWCNNCCPSEGAFNNQKGQEASSLSPPSLPPARQAERQQQQRQQQQWQQSDKQDVNNLAPLDTTISLMLKGQGGTAIAWLQSLWLAAATVVCDVLCWLREEENFHRWALPLQQRQCFRQRTGHDDNNNTIVGSNGFVHLLKQQSTHEGGEQGERWWWQHWQ